MTHKFAATMFTANVKAAQLASGSFKQNENLEKNFGPNAELTVREVDFIAQRDSFYLASVSETLWPYVQHRGGPKGFLKIISGNLLAYPDFRGNTQLISTGNFAGNDRCSIILMDYTKKRRLKILGRVRVEDVSSLSEEILAELTQSDYQANIERVFFIDVHAFDWNCPQHITPRFSLDEQVKMKGETQIV
ncbi:MAG: putative pyridoxine 5'-phosphate oxidase superfamily flavin-nucleotide-binding protein [Glaciecola sp.]|jgi:predicted pyridoxine 5'-phosphate oxidase superfamily flavin-nucleotide-binding protein